MEISIAAEKIVSIGSFPVTNSLLVAWIAMILLMVLSFIATKSMKEVPRGIQNVFETVIEALLNFADTVTGSRALTKKFFPLIATIFIFVITVNWLGLIPGAGTIGLEHVTAEGKNVITPFIRSASADLNFTLALALISVISIQVFGIRGLGFGKHLAKFITVKSPIAFLVGLLELVSEIGKIVSFSFRLFGNIFAGEVLLTVLLMLVPYLLPLPFLMLETFVGFIQALVFAMLTLVFAKMATEEAH